MPTDRSDAANVRERSFAEAELLRLTEENARLRGHLEHALSAAETVEQVTGLATARACVFWIKECLHDG